MVSQQTPGVTSVTPHSEVFRRLPGWRKFWLTNWLLDWAGGEDRRILAEAEAQLSSQSRRDASMPSKLVNELLLSAAKGGMTQKQFEAAASAIRPNQGKAHGGFNGRLWHHYRSTDARMSCETFLEYLFWFVNAGWVDEDAARPLARKALAVMTAAEAGTDQVRLAERMAAAFLQFLGLTPRQAARSIRNFREAAHKDEAGEGAYLNFLNELPARLAGLEAYGKQLERKKQNEPQAQAGAFFGTNLAH